MLFPQLLERVSAARGVHGWLQRLSEPLTRTRRRLHRRWPRSKTTGQGRAGAGSKRQRRAPRTEPSASRGTTRQPRTRRGGGGHSQRISPPPPPTPCSLSGSRGAASPLPLPTLSPRSRRARQLPPPPTPPPPLPAGNRQRVGRPQRRRSRHQKRSLHPGGGQRRRRAASRQPHKGGGGAGGPQPALGKPPSHGRGQAAGASRVARALNPKQAQAGLGGCGGQHSKQGTSTRTPLPSHGTRPFRTGLHQIGCCDATKG